MEVSIGPTILKRRLAKAAQICFPVASAYAIGAMALESATKAGVQTMQSAQESYELSLKSGEMIVNADLLQKAKEALEAFVGGPDFPRIHEELRDQIKQELARSAIWIVNGSSGIGSWRLVTEEGGLILVRYPPSTQDTAYIYRAKLTITNSRWRVSSFEQEREFGPE
jgi:hypothetical protein